MKSQRHAQAARTPRKLSDAIIAKRYLDLQRLRAEVRKAEQSPERRMLDPNKIERPGVRPA
jgi:hypothetical protein